MCKINWKLLSSIRREEGRFEEASYSMVNNQPAGAPRFSKSRSSINCVKRCIIDYAGGVDQWQSNGRQSDWLICNNEKEPIDSEKTLWYMLFNSVRHLRDGGILENRTNF